MNTSASSQNQLLIRSQVQNPVPQGYTGVYCGRGRGSVLGNPFSLWERSPAMNKALLELRMDGHLSSEQHALVLELETRLPVTGEAIDLFELWLRNRCRVNSEQKQAVLELAAQLHSGKRQALLCWCKPQARCHVDVILKAVSGYAARVHSRS